MAFLARKELNEKKTQVGYSGAMDIDWSLSYRNKTVFVYQQLQEDGEMSPEYAEEKIGYLTGFSFLMPSLIGMQGCF